MGWYQTNLYQGPGLCIFEGNGVSYFHVATGMAAENALLNVSIGDWGCH